VRIAEVPQGRASDIIGNPRDDLVSTLTLHDGAVLVMSSRTANIFVNVGRLRKDICPVGRVRASLNSGAHDFLAASRSKIFLLCRRDRY
jgi:hypothetical protein